MIKEPSALNQRTIGHGYPKTGSHGYLKNFKESLVLIKEPEKNWQSRVSEKLQRIIGFHKRMDKKLVVLWSVFDCFRLSKNCSYIPTLVF
jgi:hypothetical protein